MLAITFIETIGLRYDKLMKLFTISDRSMELSVLQVCNAKTAFTFTFTATIPRSHHRSDND